MRAVQGDRGDRQPGVQYHNTPHNVGYQVVDVLAEEFGRNCKSYDNIAMAAMKRESGAILLIKPQTFVNKLGPVLTEWSEAMGFGPQDCVLIQEFCVGQVAWPGVAVMADTMASVQP